MRARRPPPATIRSMMRRSSLLLVAALGALGLAACDTSITGSALDNEPPTTQLAVRDTSLVDNLLEGERLTSTVRVSWTGDDPDGYVAAYELRYHDDGAAPGAWTRTTSVDTLIQLPIPRGERAADVVFEVRAIDNEGLTDPTPARTVFPIQNAPPRLRLSQFDLPPDTTYPVFTFAWSASDPEGDDNLAAVEVALNDSTDFVRLPADVRFATFVARDYAPGAATTEARVFTGRSSVNTGIDLPGLRLDANNTIYVRAVDQTDTTSVMERYTWHVKDPAGEVLYVNDYRKLTAPNVQRYHLGVLRRFLPAGTDVEVWDLSQPYSTGNTGDLVRSTALPPAADPTLRETLALFRYIYWVSSNTTNSTADNNLPFAAPVMDRFFEQGGKLIVHSIPNLPSNPDENLGNPAILLLPLSDLITFPDSLYTFFRLPRSRELQPVQPVPGTGEALPALSPTRLVSDMLPYLTEGDDNIPLYTAPFNAIRREDNRQIPWEGPSTVASISRDRRVALFGFPVVDDRNGEALFIGADGDPDAAEQAIHAVLRSLGFPR